MNYTNLPPIVIKEEVSRYDEFREWEAKHDTSDKDISTRLFAAYMAGWNTNKEEDSSTIGLVLAFGIILGIGLTLLGSYLFKSL